jgi:hypothetical protein
MNPPRRRAEVTGKFVQFFSRDMRIATVRWHSRFKAEYRTKADAMAAKTAWREDIVAVGPEGTEGKTREGDADAAVQGNGSGGDAAVTLPYRANIDRNIRRRFDIGHNPPDIRQTLVGACHVILATSNKPPNINPPVSILAKRKIWGIRPEQRGRRSLKLRPDHVEITIAALLRHYEANILAFLRSPSGDHGNRLLECAIGILKIRVGRRIGKFQVERQRFGIRCDCWRGAVCIWHPPIRACRLPPISSRVRCPDEFIVRSETGDESNYDEREGNPKEILVQFLFPIRHKTISYPFHCCPLSPDIAPQFHPCFTGATMIRYAALPGANPAPQRHHRLCDSVRGIGGDRRQRGVLDVGIGDGCLQLSGLG